MFIVNLLSSRKSSADFCFVFIVMLLSSRKSTADFCSVFIVKLLSSRKSTADFCVHRAVHPNIISTVKPTRYTNVSNLFYFEMTLYMFRTAVPSIIRSARLMMIMCQTDTAVCLANRQQYLFDKCLLLYVQS